MKRIFLIALSLLLCSVALSAQDAQKQQVEQLRKENQELLEENQALLKKISSFEEKLEAALVWNEQLRKAVFGRKSEKLRVLQTGDE